MFLSPGGTDDNPGDASDGTDDNFGPHCRNCHMGASSCDQCHGVKGDGTFKGATNVTPLFEGKSPVLPNGRVQTSAVADLDGQCIDGGFSWPHRTLGANMLKDELYGIDFDGSPIAFGVARTVPAAWAGNWTIAGSLSEFTTSTSPAYNWQETGVQLGDGIVTENLDSVCIDCHGDSTYWNGDDAATYFDSNKGWDLLFKGLP